MQGKILLVDDNEDFADSIKDVLEDEGYTVGMVNSGEKAIETTKNTAYDLIVMDIKMPGLNGVETFSRMKRDNPDVKVVLFTAFAFNELIQQAIENGVIAVLRKPLDMDTLIDTVKRAKKQLKGGAILLADDDRDLSESLFESLDASGYQVAVASDGLQAIREVENKKFDILLLDLKMPELNGLEVFRKAKAICPDLITIMITGYADELSELVDHAVEENVYALLRKPIDMNVLLDLLKKAVSENNNCIKNAQEAGDV